MLSVKSRAFYLAFSKIVGARLQHLQNGHGFAPLAPWQKENAERPTLNAQRPTSDWASWTLSVEITLPLRLANIDLGRRRFFQPLGQISSLKRLKHLAQIAVHH